tara:strand:+ start:54962 stop:56950 length:1989 start_codon:yes stop_codon:yes gene_type:complete
MCGLTGLLLSSPSDYITKHVSEMTSLLVHRGPNSEGIWTNGNIALGHRRLAIVDLSSNGAQPMSSHCGRYVLAYNGEIYNHLELRYELEKDGAAPKWLGHSDTETLLAAIANWGINKALRRSNGMFAFALWDKSKKTLSLARDRIGEKPLYWGWAGNDLIFGSELKALRAHPNFPSSICREALKQYLKFMYVPAPRSIHPNIFKLEPGTILNVKVSPPTSPPKKPIRAGESYGNISIDRYWDLAKELREAERQSVSDENEAIQMIEQVISKAVNRQMISDVPLGAFLSGGVDSSTIVALMQKHSSRPVQTFTIGFNEANYDESHHAEAVANHLGTDHKTLRVSDSMARDVIPDLPWLYDEPFADSSQIPTHLICRAARNNVTVSLSGDGGDELFAGYNRYIHGPRLWKLLSFIPYYLRGFLGGTFQKIPEDTWNKFGLAYNNIRPKAEGISNIGNKIHRLAERMYNIKNFDDLYMNMTSNWIEPEKLLVDKINRSTSQLENEIFKYKDFNPTTRMMISDILSYLPDDILCKVDRASMGVGLETRAPFLDHETIKLSMRLPLNMKIRNGKGKWALRQVLYKYVPQEIIDRPKVGFSIPIGSWIRGSLSDWAKDLLSNETLSEDRVFNSDIIQKTLKEHLSGSKDRTERLWSILMFQAWRKEQK